MRATNFRTAITNSSAARSFAKRGVLQGERFGSALDPQGRIESLQEALPVACIEHQVMRRQIDGRCRRAVEGDAKVELGVARPDVTGERRRAGQERREFAVRRFTPVDARSSALARRYGGTNGCSVKRTRARPCRRMLYLPSGSFT